MDLDAILAQRRQQEVLEAPAIELERGHRREVRRPELDAARDVAVVLVREEVAESELLELPVPQVRLEAEHDLEVVRADLDARLANLERRFRDRVLAFLGDQHADVRRLALQLAGEGQAGQTPAEDDDVVWAIR